MRTRTAITEGRHSLTAIVEEPQAAGQLWVLRAATRSLNDEQRAALERFDDARL
jgi:hypothetical protein